jgi:hypothetical protein
MSADTVRIRHSEVEGESEVVRSAYEKVWKDRGWTLVEDESEEPVQQRRTSRQPDTSGTGETKE